MKMIYFMVLFLLATCSVNPLSQKTTSATFIRETDRITEIVVKFPSKWGEMDSDIISVIRDSDKIAVLTEFTNKAVASQPGWLATDTALSGKSLVNLVFQETGTYKAAFGFSADFEGIRKDADLYGIKGTYFEFFSNTSHCKKTVTLTEAEKLMVLIDISKEDYLSMQQAWKKGIPFKK